jgi:hypothetical protein
MRTIERDALPSDIPFIYSTWLKSIRYDSALGKACRNSVFFDTYKLVIDRILRDPNTIVRVITAEDAPGTIFSYVVRDAKILHFAYTKEDFRRFGLVRRLVGGLPIPITPPASPMPPVPGTSLATANITPTQSGTHLAPPASPMPAPLPAKSEPPPNGMSPRSIICTHKTFLSQPIFDKYAELVYNPFLLYKGVPENEG